MPPIKLKHVISFTSEDKNFPADNLVKQDTYRKWKCAEAGIKQASVTIQLEKATYIHSIDIGNEGSAFVEVLVNRSDNNDSFKVLLVMSSFMSPAESIAGSNLNRVRMFGPNHLSQTVMKEKWDCVKIVCTQPFNKNIKYGLSFIRLHSPSEKENAAETSTKQSVLQLGAFKIKEEDPPEVFKPGGLFAKRKEKSTDQPLKGAAAIRAASATAEASLAKKQAAEDSKSTETLGTTVSSVTSKNREQKYRADDSPVSAVSRHKRKEERIKAFVKEQKESTEPAKRPRLFSEKEQTKKDLMLTQKEQGHQEQIGNIKKNCPYEKILEGIVFALSGFQNPYRSELRDTAVAMGAKYRPDWDTDCSHLICAFVNTPKFLQVQGKGGKIVSKEWILDCDKKRTRLNWKKYRMGGSGGGDTSTESDEDGDIAPSKNSRKRAAYPAQEIKYKTPETPSSSNQNKTPSRAVASPEKSAGTNGKSTPKKEQTTAELEMSDDDDKYSGSTEAMSCPSPDVSSDIEDEIRRVRENEVEKNVYDADTDLDDFSELETLPDTRDVPLPQLPDIFSGKFFFLYGTFDDSLRRRINRNIIAYDGKIENYMNEKVSFVITQSKWDNNFDEALSENSHLVFVRPQWIFACAKKGAQVTRRPFVVSPAVD